MNTLIAVSVLIFLLPVIILIIFNANAGVMFLAACAGLVLLSSLDPAVVTTAGTVVPGEGEAYVRLVVVALSIIFAAMFSKGTIKGRALFLHTGVVVFMSGMLWILLPSATGLSWLITSSDEQLWKSLYEFRSLIIAGGISLSLLTVLSKTKVRRSR